MPSEGKFGVSSIGDVCFEHQPIVGEQLMLGSYFLGFVKDNYRTFAKNGWLAVQEMVRPTIMVESPSTGQ